MKFGNNCVLVKGLQVYTMAGIMSPFSPFKIFKNHTYIQYLDSLDVVSLRQIVLNLYKPGLWGPKWGNCRVTSIN